MKVFVILMLATLAVESVPVENQQNEIEPVVFRQTGDVIIINTGTDYIRGKRALKNIPMDDSQLPESVPSKNQVWLNYETYTGVSDSDGQIQSYTDSYRIGGDVQRYP